MRNLFDVSGKVAVVTGGSRGIGAMIAEGFVANGVRTYITARREDELQATAASLSRQGECIALVADLSTVQGATRFVAEIREREPELHILVNNAGATWGASVDEFPENGWDTVMAHPDTSTFIHTQPLLPALRAAGTDTDPARVINIGSVNGITNSHMQNYSYTASKAAVHHLTRHMGAELARERVNVNAIAPGLFPSKMTAHMAGHEEEMVKAFPISRMGAPEDAAGTAIYLSSRASAWVTGHVLVLDGGLVAAS
ncbi:MAG: SDR family oxidoreductase [Haliea sp.]